MKTTPETQRPDTHRLNFINPRQTLRIQRAREGRLARVMMKVRLWLPLSAGIIIMLLFLWPYIAPNVILKNVVKKIPDLVIDNLHYSGLDNKNEPYSLNAAEATRPSDLHGIYDLKQPQGEITLQSGAWLYGKADFGRYDEVGHRLWLGGNVEIFHDNGDQMTTDEAQVNLNNDDAWGEKKVLIQGSFGTIRGQGFRFLDSGHTVIILGPGQALLNLRAAAASDKPVAGDNHTQ